MKRFSLCLVAAVLLIGLFASQGMAKDIYKIGVMTGTVSQSEDEYRAAEMLRSKYGEMIRHVTYPDNFMQEQETTIAQILGLASDKDVKAIVICHAVPGAVAAARKVREIRPDIIFVFGAPQEDPGIVNVTADLSFMPDDEARGVTIPRLAKELGAKKFLFYSFPRHMSIELLAKQRDVTKAECAKLGMEFIFVTAPDPMGEGGIPASQQFILEDVPRQVERHGKDVAFYSTNCAMQEPLINAVLDAGAIFPEQCCPSPTHGYPGAIGLEITDEIQGNMPGILREINKIIVSRGGAGRFATWPVPIMWLILESGVEIARDVIEGKIDISDMNAVRAKMSSIAGVEVNMKRYYEDKGNFYLVTCGSVVFGRDNF